MQNDFADFDTVASDMSNTVSAWPPANNFVFGALFYVLKQAGKCPSPDHPFMLAMNSFLTQQHPFQLNLQPHEKQYHKQIIGHDIGSRGAR